jgi:hypothetical protein
MCDSWHEQRSPDVVASQSRYWPWALQRMSSELRMVCPRVSPQITHDREKRACIVDSLAGDARLRSRNLL